MSGAPSAFIRQHHELEAPRVDARQFRQNWRIRSPVDKLLAAKLITATEYRRALSFRRLYETASKGAAASSVWNRSFAD